MKALADVLSSDWALVFIVLIPLIGGILLSRLDKKEKADNSNVDAGYSGGYYGDGGSDIGSSGSDGCGSDGGSCGGDGGGGGGGD